MIVNNQGKPVSQRQLRVGEVIKQALSNIFSRGEAKVPNLDTSLKALRASSSVAEVYLALFESFKRQCNGETPG